jgi:hypothetical protein
LHFGPWPFCSACSLFFFSAAQHAKSDSSPHLACSFLRYGPSKPRPILVRGRTSSRFSLLLLADEPAPLVSRPLPPVGAEQDSTESGFHKRALYLLGFGVLPKPCTSI